MKKNFLFAWIMLLSTIAYTQSIDNQSSPKITHQLGIDASGFITRFISINTQTIESNAGLIFLYRKGMDGKNFRLALSPRFDINKDTDTNRKNSFFSLITKIGIEYYTDFGKRWRAYTGWDIRFSGFNSLRKQDKLKSVFRGVELGAGPIAGLQFKINKRLSLSTEAFYEVVFDYDFRKSNEGSIDETYAFESRFSPLSFITLNYHF